MAFEQRTGFPEEIEDVVTCHQRHFIPSP